MKIPKTRTGSFFPALLAPRRRIDVALHAVIMQAYVEGVSTRRVDDLVVAMGGTGVSKSEVSRICAQLDAEVAAWRTRPLDEQPFPYVFADATYCKARVNGRVVSQAVVIATGVRADGHREVLGCAVGDSETEAFWTEFLRDLRGRGLHGVQLVVSDAHTGLTAAIATVLQGATWQRCRVHFLRNVLAKVPKAEADMVAAYIRTVFAQPTPGAVRDQLDTVADTLAVKLPAVAEPCSATAKADLTAFADFPHAHWAKIWSHQPHRTSQQGTQAAHRRRRDLPEHRRPAAAVGLRAHRSPRRVARRRPPLPIRRAPWPCSTPPRRSPYPPAPRR